MDPFSSEIKTGWPDTEPYTDHKVTTWFSNDAGESDKTEADGYNYQSTPETPKLDQQGDDEPTSITVKFDAMSDDDINGKFTEYEVRFALQIVWFESLVPEIAETRNIGL